MENATYCSNYASQGEKQNTILASFDLQYFWNEILILKN